MKAAIALILTAGTLTACGVRPMPVALPGGMAQTVLEQAAAKPVKAPIALAKGLKLSYAITAVTGGKQVATTHLQEIQSVSASEATIRHTIPGPNGTPASFLETVRLEKALVSSRWTSEAPLMTTIDPDLGQPATLTVKAGTFKTKKVLLHANGLTETWWFSGAVPVKVNFKGLNAHKLEVTAELASY